MASLDFRALQIQLNRGDLKSLYCLHGEEVFLIDEILAILKEKVLDGGLPDFNLNIFYAGDASVESVADAIETLPMMAPRRLVIVKEAQEFSATELERLLPLIENPVESTTLVFVAGKIDMRKKFFKVFDSKGVVVKFQKLFDNQVAPWVQHIAAKFDKQLSSDASDLIRECAGANLIDINNEMRKVAQYVGERKQVTSDDVRQVVSRVKTDTVFELVNCLGEGRAADSFVHLANLLDHGQNEVGVLAMVTRHFRILTLCKEALKEGLSQAQIASRVGVHGFFVREYIEQAKGWDLSDLVQIYDVMLDTDRALKSNPLSSHIWLENLVLQSCKLRRKELGQRPAPHGAT